VPYKPEEESVTANQYHSVPEFPTLWPCDRIVEASFPLSSHLKVSKRVISRLDSVQSAFVCQATPYLHQCQGLFKRGNIVEKRPRVSAFLPMTYREKIFCSSKTHLRSSRAIFQANKRRDNEFQTAVSQPSPYCFANISSHTPPQSVSICMSPSLPGYQRLRRLSIVKPTRHHVRLLV
jgi:hypothetical protein